MVVIGRQVMIRAWQGVQLRMVAAELTVMMHLLVMAVMEVCLCLFTFTNRWTRNMLHTFAASVMREREVYLPCQNTTNTYTS